MKFNKEKEDIIKTNKEIEKLNNENNSWLLMYAENSSFYIPNALHVERNDELNLVEDDEEASKVAENNYIKLIYGMENVPDGVYVDTEENREIIKTMLEKYPEYKYSDS